MPIPKPRENEEQSEFLDRCMSNPTMTEEFPESDARLAVCSVTWDDAKKRSKKSTADSRELKHITVPFSKKEATDGGYFEGYGAVFGNVDFGGDVIMPGAFKGSLEEWKSSGELPAMVYIHDIREPIGEYKEMREDETGLWVAGDLWTPDVPRAVQARRMLRSNGPKGLSIGYIAEEVSFDERADGTTVRLLHKIQLMEVSPVLFAMNNLARPTTAKGLFNGEGELASKRDLEHALCFSLQLSKRQAKAFISGGYDALRDAAATPPQETREAAELLQAVKNLHSVVTGEADMIHKLKKLGEK